MAYSTFSILQVFHNGDAYLVEYDNPGCIFIRDGKLMEIPQNIRELQGKRINEYRFKVQKGDALILMSDGTIHAGVGDLLNFGWLWKDIADYSGDAYLGIDCGSTTTKLVLMSDSFETLYRYYSSSQGNPVGIVRQQLQKIYEACGDRVKSVMR